MQLSPEWPPMAAAMKEAILDRPADVSGPRELLEPSARARPQFYSRMAAVLLLAVAVGFTPTLYLRPFFEVPALEPRVLLHAAVLTAWFVAFWVQATLVARRSIAWHRRVGWVVAAIGLTAVLTSVWITLAAVQDGTIMPRTVWSNLANAAAFAVFLAAAIALRRDSDSHRRLMLLASIAFVQPATARLFFRSGPLADLGLNPLVGGLVLSLLFLVPLVVHDIKTRKSLHAATLIGGASLIVARLVAVFMIAGSSTGQSVLRWLT
jgi:hypothetical protein